LALGRVDARIWSTWRSATATLGRSGLRPLWSSITRLIQGSTAQLDRPVLLSVLRRFGAQHLGCSAQSFLSSAASALGTFCNQGSHLLLYSDAWPFQLGSFCPKLSQFRLPALDLFISFCVCPAYMSLISACVCSANPTPAPSLRPLRRSLGACAPPLWLSALCRSMDLSVLRCSVAPVLGQFLFGPLLLHRSALRQWASPALGLRLWFFECMHFHVSAFVPFGTAWLTCLCLFLLVCTLACLL